MKKKIARIVVEITVIIGLLVAFVLINDQVNDDRLNSFRYMSDSNNYAFEVENFSIDGKEAVLSGWFFELESVLNKPRVVDRDKVLGIVLYDLNSEVKSDIAGNEKTRKAHRFNVTRTERQDINAFFECKYNYSQCGFTARIDKSLINMENGQYQIVLKVDENDFPGIPAAYINKGKLQYVNPKESMELQVEGTDLEKIVKDGYCVLSYPENFFCVYQYGKNLYWIADKGFFFEEDGSTYIQYQMYTTQFDKLPANRIKNDLFWSNIGDDFEKYEVTNKMECGDYRVSIRSIPEEYAVYRIVTGYRVDDKWIWQRYFRPII